MALAIATITNSIAAISVTGVTIYDMDVIPVTTKRLGVSLFPKPDGFVTNFKVTRQSQGTATALYDVNYTLNYTFAAYPIGAGRGLELYDDMVSKAFAVMDAVIVAASVSGAVGFDVNTIPSFGRVYDPEGNAFMGCEMSFDVLEFVN